MVNEPPTVTDAAVGVVNVKVGVGSIDAHVGAVGGQIKKHFLSKVIGTSTCDMAILEYKSGCDIKLIDGICGQVMDSIVPGYIGLEAGQSAFGDVFAWFRDLLLKNGQFCSNRRPLY